MPLASHVAQTWLLKLARDADFERFVQNRRWKHPETGNQVLFVSLPVEEQAKIRAQFHQQVEPEPVEDKTWTTSLTEKARQAVDSATEAGQNFIRFVSDPEFRKETAKQFREKKTDFTKRLAREFRESKDMLKTFGKVISGEEVSEEEKKAAIEQLKDVGKLAVLGTLAVAPLGPFDDILFFLITAGMRLAYPEFTWKPSSWRMPIEASESKDLAALLAERLFHGIQAALENPPPKVVEEALDELAQRRGA